MVQHEPAHVMHPVSSEAHAFLSHPGHGTSFAAHLHPHHNVSTSFPTTAANPIPPYGHPGYGHQYYSGLPATMPHPGHPPVSHPHGTLPSDQHRPREDPLRHRTRTQMVAPPPPPNAPDDIDEDAIANMPPSSDRPCAHNNWDDVRTRKGSKILRCRNCQRKWKLSSSHVPRCIPFLRGHCPNEPCSLLHVHKKKSGLEERVAQFGPVVIRAMPREAQEEAQKRMVKKAHDDNQSRSSTPSLSGRRGSDALDFTRGGSFDKPDWQRTFDYQGHSDSSARRGSLDVTGGVLAVLTSPSPSPSPSPVPGIAMRRTSYDSSAASGSGGSGGGNITIPVPNTHLGAQPSPHPYQQQRVSIDPTLDPSSSLPLDDSSSELARRPSLDALEAARRLSLPAGADGGDPNPRVHPRQKFADAIDYRDLSQYRMPESTSQHEDGYEGPSQHRRSSFSHTSDVQGGEGSSKELQGLGESGSFDGHPPPLTTPSGSYLSPAGGQLVSQSPAQDDLSSMSPPFLLPSGAPGSRKSSLGMPNLIDSRRSSTVSTLAQRLEKLQPHQLQAAVASLVANPGTGQCVSPTSSGSNYLPEYSPASASRRSSVSSPSAAAHLKAALTPGKARGGKEKKNENDGVHAMTEAELEAHMSRLQAMGHFQPSAE